MGYSTPVSRVGWVEMRPVQLVRKFTSSGTNRLDDDMNWRRGEVKVETHEQKPLVLTREVKM